MSENKQEWPWLAPVSHMPTWLHHSTQLDILRFDKSTTKCTARYLSWGSKYVGVWRPNVHSVVVLADGVTEYTTLNLDGDVLFGSNDGKPPRPSTVADCRPIEIPLKEGKMPVFETIKSALPNATWRKLDAPAADNVYNPPHYKQGEIECIDAIRAALTPEEFRGYCKGNMLKYTWRERHKGGDESVQKALWYGNKLLESGE